MINLEITMDQLVVLSEALNSFNYETYKNSEGYDVNRLSEDDFEQEKKIIMASLLGAGMESCLSILNVKKEEMNSSKNTINSFLSDLILDSIFQKFNK